MGKSHAAKKSTSLSSNPGGPTFGNLAQFGPNRYRNFPFTIISCAGKQVCSPRIFAVRSHLMGPATLEAMMLGSSLW